MFGSRKGNLSGSASSILERAQGQLQGRRFGVVTKSTGSLNKTAPVQDNEEDDLNAYLSQLSRKTGKSTRNNVEDDDSDLSDIDISSEEELGLGLTNSSLNASKFLKKSHSQTLTSDTAKQASTAKPIRKSSTAPNFLNKTAPAFTSSALQKAAQLGAKFAKKKAVIAKQQDSDSDDGLKFKASVPGRNEVSSDEGIGNRFLKTPAKKTFFISESDDEAIKTESEDNFGGDGNRFLKKSAQPKQEPAESDVSLDEVPASRFLKKKLSGTTGPDGFSTSTPKKDIASKQNKDKERLSRTAPVKSLHHLGMSLDSDEEDMQNFIDNLTPTSTPEVPPIRDVTSSGESEEETDREVAKPAHKRTVTPGPGKQTYHVSSSESSDESVGEDMGSSVSESIDEAVDFGANVMRIEDLLPASSQISEQRTSKSKDKKVAKKAWSESDKSESILSDKNDHPALNLAGLQTVDDLLKRDSDEPSYGRDEHGYGSDFETATEIATQRTEEVPEESFHSEIQTGRMVETEDTHSSVDSVSKSITDTSTRTIPDSYTSDSRTSNHSQSSRNYSRRSYTRSKTRSGKRSSSEQTQTYSEDFQSATHEGTDTEAEDLPSDDASTITQSRSYTSYSETTTIVTPKKKKEGRPRRGMKDASVQADGTEGLLHHWITDSDIAGIGSVTRMKDPTPVTTHIVNPEALQALTNFSPSLLALNDSLLAQLQYARESVQNSLRLHRSLVGSIENDFEYITLENTKQFISRQRSLRPKLTMEQALIMVKQEMEENDRL